MLPTAALTFFAVAALLGAVTGQAINATQCTSMAQAYAACIATPYGSNVDPVRMCCNLSTPFVTQCGGFDGLYANKFYLPDYATQQRIVNHMSGCQGA